jgi:hypothetical protein
MILPLAKTLTKSIIESIPLENVPYAEVSPPGAMGNNGGVIIYYHDIYKNEMICYETNVFHDEESYLAAEDLFYIYYNGEKSNNEKYDFKLYYGAFGNLIFINTKVNLTIQDDFFVYHANNLDFQIRTSVPGIFIYLKKEMQL